MSDSATPKYDRALARWTGVVALFTGLLFLANLATNFFIYQQWSVANRTFVDEREKARAAVTLQLVNEFILPDKDGKLLGYAFFPQFQNSGTSRTSEFKAWYNVQYFEHDIPDNIDLTKQLTKVDPWNGAVINANSIFPMSPITISAEYINKVFRKEGVVAVWGHAEYADIFDPQIIKPINFCFRSEVATLVNGKTVIQMVPYKTECNFSS
jgi:hypothetical protein